MEKGLKEFAERNALGLYPDERVVLARGNSYISGPSQRAAFVDGFDLGFKTCVGQVLDRCDKVRKNMEVNQLTESEFEYAFSEEYHMTVHIKLDTKTL